MSSQNRNYQEQALNSMFPKPVENVNEVIAKEDCIDGDNVSQEKVVEELKVNPIKESDIFMQPKKKKQNIVLKVDDGEKNTKKKKTGTKKDRYAHLAAARAKGAETRKKKAAERKAKKEAEKLEKQRLKDERKKASMERNRQRARDRYYREKQEKEKIVKNGKLQAKSTPINIPKKPTPPVKPAGMDFNTFAEYMLKYENMKKRYKAAVDLQTIQKKEAAAKAAAEKKKQEYHPPNYPLAHLYNPANRKNTTFF